MKTDNKNAEITTCKYSLFHHLGFRFQQLFPSHSASLRYQQIGAQHRYRDAGCQAAWSKFHARKPGFAPHFDSPDRIRCLFPVLDASK
jgi:hypothetical protein